MNSVWEGHGNHEYFAELCTRLWIVNKARDAARLRGNVKLAERLQRIAGNITEELLSLP